MSDDTTRTEDVFVNAKVFTGTGEDDFATAFRVRDGRFDWVGDSAQLSGDELASAHDLGGRTVLPGFLDVHTHPSMMATLSSSVSLLPPRIVSLAALLDELRTHPAYGAGEDSWILGFGFDEMWFTDEKRKPTARDLDTVSADQPIFVRRCDGHTIVCNTRALQMAGITAATPDPDGGIIERDADGEPTGALSERSALALIEDLLPRPTAEEHAELLAGLEEHFLSRGIVGVDDLLATSNGDDPLAVYRAAEAAGFSPQSGLYLGWTDLVKNASGGAVPDLTADQVTGRTRVAGVKLFLDGAFSDRNAWTTEPYPDSCSHGIRVASDDDLRDAVEWSRRNHVQVAIHAMGDGALTQAIALFEDDEPWMGEIPSIRLDHASLFTPEMIERVASARMSFGVVSHTIFYFAEYESYRRNLSPAQFPNAYPIRSFYEKVDHVALASDCPATSWADADDVFVSVRAAVERRSHNGGDLGQAQAITVPQALLLYTGRAGTVSPLEGLGRIADGYEASFLVLDRDVFTVPVDEITEVNIEETWVSGRSAWTASERRGAVLTG